MSHLAIHGDKQQNERDWVLNEFKTGKSPIMVATDVASRGIGMIEIPPPYPSPSSPRSNGQSSSQWCFTLNAQALSRFALFCPGSSVSLGSLSRASWISSVALLCFTCNSKLRRTISQYIVWNWHF